MFRKTATNAIVTAASFAAIATGLALAAPATAAEAKPIAVTVPAAALPSEESRLCLPKTMVGRGKDKEAPATMCHTRVEWASQGVTINLKAAKK